MGGRTNLVILGAGGFGREVHQWICDANAGGAGWNVLGFLDGALAGQTVHGLPVLGDVDWLDGHRDVAAVVAVGATAPRRKLLARLAGWGIALPSLIDVTARVGRNVHIGEGTVICPGVILTTDITVGRGVILNLNVTVGHDAVIEDGCTLAPGVHVSGYVRIGEGCDLGTGVTLVPGVTVGAWSTVGAGAVVAANLPGDVVAVGVPARPIKQREPGWHLG